MLQANLWKGHDTQTAAHPTTCSILMCLCVLHVAICCRIQSSAVNPPCSAGCQALPSASEPLDELLAATTHSKGQLLEVSRDWKLVDTSSMAGLDHFESHLSSFKDQVEAEMARLTASAQHLTETDGWWEQPQQVGWEVPCEDRGARYTM